jgi:hypothetical protein
MAENGLQERTRIARLLFGGAGKMSSYDRELAEGFFGKAEILREEVQPESS